MASKMKFKEWLKTDHGRLVFKECASVALDVKRRGHDNYGISGVIEIVRWHRYCDLRDDKGFKVSNNWKPLLSRRLMKMYPRLKGFFRIKDMPALEV